MIPFTNNSSLKFRSSPTFAACKSHVTKQLCLVNALNLFDGLDFNDHPVLNAQIKAITGINRDSLVFEGQDDLRIHGKPSLLKFINEALFVSAFEQAWSEFRVNFNSRPDDFARDLIDFYASVSSVFSVVNDVEVIA